MVTVHFFISKFFSYNSKSKICVCVTRSTQHASDSWEAGPGSLQESVHSCKSLWVCVSGWVNVVWLGVRLWVRVCGVLSCARACTCACVGSTTHALAAAAAGAAAQRSARLAIIKKGGGGGRVCANKKGCAGAYPRENNKVGQGSSSWLGTRGRQNQLFLID